MTLGSHDNDRKNAGSGLCTRRRRRRLWDAPLNCTFSLLLLPLLLRLRVLQIFKVAQHLRVLLFKHKLGN